MTRFGPEGWTTNQAPERLPYPFARTGRRFWQGPSGSVLSAYLKAQSRWVYENPHQLRTVSPALTDQMIFNPATSW